MSHSALYESIVEVLSENSVTEQTVKSATLKLFDKINDIFDSRSQKTKEIHSTDAGYKLLIGKTYYKIVTISNREPNKEVVGSAVAFIDKTTGDILKPASFNAPAKHARGNVLSRDNGMEAFNVDKQYGSVSVLYR